MQRFMAMDHRRYIGCTVYWVVPPPDVYVGAANLPPATLRLQPVGLNGIAHQRVRIQPVRLNGTTRQRNCRERPMCRSGGRCNYNPCGQPEPPTDMSFRGSEASRGIFPSGKLYLVLVILATWEDPSTPFYFGRDDMSGGGTIQPHRLYSGRGGRQVCRPYIHVGGWYHSIYGTPNVAAMIHRHMQRNE